MFDSQDATVIKRTLCIFWGQTSQRENQNPSFPAVMSVLWPPHPPGPLSEPHSSVLGRGCCPCSLMSHLEVLLLQRRPSRTDPTVWSVTDQTNKCLPEDLSLNCRDLQCWWGSWNNEPFSIGTFYSGKLKAKLPLGGQKRKTDLAVTFSSDCIRSRFQKQ